MNPIREDLTAFGFGGGGGGSSELITRIETLEENVETLEDDIDKAFSQMNYSTQEHEIGEWINGKKLYNKTIVGNTSNSSSDWGDSGVTIDFDELVKSESTIKFTNGIILTNGVKVKYDNTVQFFQDYYSASTEYDYICTLYYTKTE